MIITVSKDLSLTRLRSFIKLVLGPGLLYARGPDHQRQKRMMDPMFTANRIRTLTPNIYDVAHKVRSSAQIRFLLLTSRKLSQKVSGMLASEGSISAEIDVLRLASATAFDVIGFAGLGHDFDALGDETPYAWAMKEFMYVFF